MYICHIFTSSPHGFLRNDNLSLVKSPSVLEALWCSQLVVLWCPAHLHPHHVQTSDYHPFLSGNDKTRFTNFDVVIGTKVQCLLATIYLLGVRFESPNTACLKYRRKFAHIRALPLMRKYSALGMTSSLILTFLCYTFSHRTLESGLVAFSNNIIDHMHKN